MQLARAINAVITFLLELAMLGCFSYWGYKFGHTLVIKMLFAFTMPLVAAVLWGVFAAPKSTRRLPFIPRLIFQLFIFMLAAALVYNAGQSLPAYIMAAFAFLTTVLAIFTR